MASILIIEDDLRLATFTQMTLQAKGYKTHLALTGEAGQKYLESEAVDLILLDLDLPDISGVRLCENLRRSFSLPIVIFSAEGQVSAKVEALEAGADDYIVKPIDIRELVARVRAQLQAVARRQPAAAHKIGALSYDPQSDQFATPAGVLALTETSHRLLAALFLKKGGTLLKAELYDQVWEGAYDPERDGHLIEVKISRLRQQLKKHDTGCSIRTAYGKGYYLAADQPQA